MTDESNEPRFARVLQEYETQRAKALAMGGPDKLARRAATGMLNARERCGKFQVRGGIVNRIALENEQRVDRARVHRVSQLSKRLKLKARARLNGFGVFDRRAGGAERVIGRVRERMNLGRLPVSRDDDRSAAMGF